MLNAQCGFVFWLSPKAGFVVSGLQSSVCSLSPSVSAVEVKSVTVQSFLWFVGLFRRVVLGISQLALLMYLNGELSTLFSPGQFLTSDF